MDDSYLDDYFFFKFKISQCFHHKLLHHIILCIRALKLNIALHYLLERDNDLLKIGVILVFVLFSYATQALIVPVSENQNRLSNLPRFEVLSKLDNIPNLNNFDVERNFLRNINFQ